MRSASLSISSLAPAMRAPQPARRTGRLALASLSASASTLAALGRDRQRGDEAQRRLVFELPVEHLVVQVVGDVEHHGDALRARRVERFGDFREQVLDAADVVIARFARLDESPLVELLQGVGGAFGNLADDEDQRRAIARRGHERCADLCEARSAGDGGQSRHACGARITIRHRDRTRFIARRVETNLGRAPQRTPELHVAIAHHAEKLGALFLGQCPGNGVVDFHRCAAPLVQHC